MDLFYCCESHVSPHPERCESCQNMWSGMLAPPRAEQMTVVGDDDEDAVRFPLNIRLRKLGQGLWEEQTDDPPPGFFWTVAQDYFHFRLLGFTRVQTQDTQTPFQVKWYADTRHAACRDDCVRMFAGSNGGQAISFWMGGQADSDGDGCAYSWVQFDSDHSISW